MAQHYSDSETFFNTSSNHKPRTHLSTSSSDFLLFLLKCPNLRIVLQSLSDLILRAELYEKFYIVILTPPIISSSYHGMVVGLVASWLLSWKWSCPVNGLFINFCICYIAIHYILHMYLFLVSGLTWLQHTTGPRTPVKTDHVLSMFIVFYQGTKQELN